MEGWATQTRFGRFAAAYIYHGTIVQSNNGMRLRASLCQRMGRDGGGPHAGMPSEVTPARVGESANDTRYGVGVALTHVLAGVRQADESPTATTL